MIISKAPVRITLGGGGTDLPSYYENHEGILVAGAINKYIFVGANEQFYNNYNLKYSEIEMCDEIDDIKHSLIREAIKYVGVEPGIEITSLADIPAGTGLGSSGAFLVSLLNTLYHYNEIDVTKRELAEVACKIELDILKEHEGKQDKYTCSYGGLYSFQFHQNGDVSVLPLRNEDIIRSTLEDKLYLFYNGRKRDGLASEALKNQDVRTRKGEKDMLNYLHQVKDIGIKSKQALEQRSFDEFSSLMKQQWEVKKLYAPSSTNEEIDRIFKVAEEYGATSCKVIGAPGGGFMMFYHPGEPKEQWKFEEKMGYEGLYPIDFKFDTKGVRTITKEGE